MLVEFFKEAVSDKVTVEVSVRPAAERDPFDYVVVELRNSGHDIEDCIIEVAPPDGREFNFDSYQASGSGDFGLADLTASSASKWRMDISHLEPGKTAKVQRPLLWTGSLPECIRVAGIRILARLEGFPGYLGIGGWKWDDREEVEREWNLLPVRAEPSRFTAQLMDARNRVLKVKAVTPADIEERFGKPIETLIEDGIRAAQPGIARMNAILRRAMNPASFPSRSDDQQDIGHSDYGVVRPAGSKLEAAPEGRDAADQDIIF